MKKYFWILCIPLLLIACRNKGQLKNSKSFIINNINQTIDIIIYQNGKQITTANGSISMLPNSIKEIENITESTEPFTFNLMFCDSLNIIYGKTVESIHYINAEGNNPKALKKNNSRNFSQGNNWQKKIIEDSRKKIKVEYTYTFTEQDYLDAKK